MIAPSFPLLVLPAFAFVFVQTPCFRPVVDFPPPQPLHSKPAAVLLSRLTRIEAELFNTLAWFSFSWGLWSPKVLTTFWWKHLSFLTVLLKSARLSHKLGLWPFIPASPVCDVPRNLLCGSPSAFFPPLPHFLNLPNTVP